MIYIYKFLAINQDFTPTIYVFYNHIFKNQDRFLQDHLLF